MKEENTGTKEQDNILRICVTVLFFLFVISVCVLGMLTRVGGYERSIGGFIDLTPDAGRNTRFVIIGGRVFYPDREAKNYTFPKEAPEETAIEKTDDASETTVTLQQIDTIDKKEFLTEPAKLCKEHYSITRYPLIDNRSKDYKDDVKWIELFTLTDGDRKVWTQEADIDLFRNDDGRIENLSPGTEGYFRFQLNNKSGSTVHAVMSVSEPEDGTHLPMVFSLRDENTGKQSAETVLEKDNSVRLSFDIDKDGSGVYRLNWKWPYESGDDTYDGLIGSQAGKYILNAEIYAETID